MEWRLWAAGAALALVIGVVPATAAADDGPETRPDLSGVLASPPALDFMARPEGVYGGTRIGALDLDAIVAENNGSAAVRSELRRQRFTRAYRKLWAQAATSTLLIEKVEEFELNAGAWDHLVRAHAADQRDRNFRGFFDTGALTDGWGGQVPAYGVRMVDADGQETDSVLFAKGNLLFVVAMSRPDQSATGPALAQAQDQYREAPSQTIDQAGKPDRLPPPPLVPAGSQLNPVVLLIALGAIVVLAIPVLLLVLLAAQRGRPRPVPVLSADRRYWWDGTAWRDTTASVPTGAPRSPDGAHWYDGTAWRPVVPPGTGA